MGGFNCLYLCLQVCTLNHHGDWTLAFYYYFINLTVRMHEIRLTEKQNLTNSPHVLNLELLPGASWRCSTKCKVCRESWAAGSCGRYLERRMKNPPVTSSWQNVLVSENCGVLLNLFGCSKILTKPRHKPARVPGYCLHLYLAASPIPDTHVSAASGASVS